jgi:hypothetical protein
VQILTRMAAMARDQGVTDFGPDRRSSFDRLRMSGYLFPLMVSLSNHGRDHVRVHPRDQGRW